MLGILAPAFETGPVAGRQRRHLIKEKQLGVAVAPHFAMATFEINLTVNPMMRCRPSRLEGPVGTVNTSAIPHEVATHGIKKEIAKRINSTRKGHLL
jgi:hypothetical protein